jgi:hypothetical protein
VQCQLFAQKTLLMPSETSPQVYDQEREWNTYIERSQQASGIIHDHVTGVEHGQDSHFMGIADNIVDRPAFQQGKSRAVGVGQVERDEHLA